MQIKKQQLEPDMEQRTGSNAYSSQACALIDQSLGWAQDTRGRWGLGHVDKHSLVHRARTVPQTQAIAATPN